MKILILKHDENPTVFIESDNEEIIYALEERKFKEIEGNNPEFALNVAKDLLGGQPDYEIHDITEIPENVNPEGYLGLSFDNNYLMQLVNSKGLFYFQHIHKPGSKVYSSPKQFFTEIAKLIDSGLKVGWFQGKWKCGNNSIDLNRCVLEKKKHKRCPMEFYDSIQLCQLIAAMGYFPKVKPMDVSIPLHAVNKLINGEFDVLVIGNLIVSKNEKELRKVLK